MDSADYAGIDGRQFETLKIPEENFAVGAPRGGIAHCGRSKLRPYGCVAE